MWLAGASAICYFGGGIMLWRGSYQEYIASELPWQPLILLAIAAFFLSWRGVGLFASSFVVGISLPAAVMTRVVVDTLQDPTSHNLWPFEIALACFLAVLGVLPFATLGGMVGRLTSR